MLKVYVVQPVMLGSISRREMERVTFVVQFIVNPNPILVDELLFLILIFTNSACPAASVPTLISDAKLSRTKGTPAVLFVSFAVRRSTSPSSTNDQLRWLR